MSGMKQNIAGMLSYLGLPLGWIGLVVPVAFLLFGPHKKNHFARFHAFQSIVLGAVVSLVWNLANLGGELSRGATAAGIVAVVLLTLFLMSKAYVNEMFRVPGFGDVAMRLAGRDAPRE